MPSPIASSIQSTPRTLSAKTSSQSLASAPLELPESLISQSPTLIGDEVHPANRQPGLIRRISRGAKDKFNRRRQSSSTQRRDHSSGPLIRRRSDSKSNGTTGTVLADYSHEEEDDEEAVLEQGRPPRDGSVSGTDSGGLAPSNANPVGTAPTVPKELQAGVDLVKVSRKRKQRYRFFLDDDGSKVSWFSNRAKQFYIDDIKEIRVGNDTHTYREEFNATDQESDCWFTIIYVDPEKGRTKAMHLIALDRTELSLWTTTLENLSRHRVEMMTGLTGSEERETVIKAHWDREMNKLFGGAPRLSGEESLDLPAIEQLARSLHINCSKDTLREQFVLADASRTGRLNYDEFRDFVRRLKERKDLRDIYLDLLAKSASPKGLAKDGFLAFLRLSQGIDVGADPAKWSSEFERLAKISTPKASSKTDEREDTDSQLMTFDAFHSFMVSSYCSVYSAPLRKTKLDRPLNEYFISSSHNTYLVDRQLVGRASTEMYVSALRLGCRCVEIDCWDGPKGEPLVNHGRTMSSPAPFADCVSVINRYAFDASPYPLILSLEVHCNDAQQARMVQILKEVFGPRLVTFPVHPLSTVLPSPEELRYRVLVKVKTHESSRELARLGAETIGRKRSASSPYTRPNMEDSISAHDLPTLSSPPSMSPSGSVPAPMFSPAQRSMTTTSASSAEDSDSLQDRSREGRSGRKAKTSKIIPDLARLGVYLQGYKYRGFEAPESHRYNHVFSLAEGSAMNLCKHPELKVHFENHNLHYLSRVYPGGFRIKSSNFDPIVYWRRGVQMVALNWQTYDEGMQINRAMFANSGDRKGYVLKPDYLRRPPVCNDMRSLGRTKLKINRQLVKFSVNMISAQQLPRLGKIGSDDSINPFIEIQMFSADDQRKGSASAKGAGYDLSARDGVSGSGRPYRMRTKIVQDNGYNPVFNEQIELSLETRYPELVFVRWIVYNSPDGRTMGSSCPQLAVFTAKLSNLQQGYRHLPLVSGEGEEFIFSTLFCKIKKEDSVAMLDLQDETVKSERQGILRSIGHTLMKRTLSSDREREKDRDRREKSSLEEGRYSQDTVSSTRT
ncbi:putative 1-phosphatidylinositol-bisphosphate phosphodiesterase [Phaeomoniella chlamydospora]|uniref:Phosphoinositide phospholipase C n=1 Tax=Phaeomoniella chlamydospora TaxID=158046 RepID=A0A0G2GCP7_PHACM|nr:putative 1-phosphatidylinositol-bisphosphate phosphodiesterase [Phaeomoniella chlamydospora]